MMLPSPYLRYPFFYRSLNPRDMLDAFILCLVAVQIAYKVISIIKEFRNEKKDY